MGCLVCIVLPRRLLLLRKRENRLLRSKRFARIFAHLINGLAVLETKDFVSQLLILLPKCSVLFTDLVKDVLLLTLHLLERLNSLLVLQVLSFSLLMQFAHLRFLLFNYGFE